MKDRGIAPLAIIAIVVISVVVGVGYFLFIAKSAPGGPSDN
jgi:hypothetical protein